MRTERQVAQDYLDAPVQRAVSTRHEVGDQPGQLTLLIDRGAPPDLAPALAASIAWHTRERVSLTNSVDADAAHVLLRVASHDLVPGGAPADARALPTRPSVPDHAPPVLTITGSLADSWQRWAHLAEVARTGRCLGVNVDPARALRARMTVMESYVERPPLPGLAGVVRTVWIQRTGAAAYVQRHLPTGGVGIHFPIGGHPQLVGPLIGTEMHYHHLKSTFCRPAGFTRTRPADQAGVLLPLDGPTAPSHRS